MATQIPEFVSLGTRDSQTLILRGERLSRQSLFSCSASAELMRLSRQRTAASRPFIRDHPFGASALGSIIRQKLRSGGLPSTRAARIFGGPGAGGRCGACGRELRATQLVMELPTFAGQVLFVHADCFIVWDAERVTLSSSIVGEQG